MSLRLWGLECSWQTSVQAKKASARKFVQHIKHEEQPHPRILEAKC